MGKKIPLINKIRIVVLLSCVPIAIWGGNTGYWAAMLISMTVIVSNMIWPPFPAPDPTDTADDYIMD